MSFEPVELIKTPRSMATGLFVAQPNKCLMDTPRIRHRYRAVLLRTTYLSDKNVPLEVRRFIATAIDQPHYGSATFFLGDEIATWILSKNQDPADPEHSIECDANGWFLHSFPTEIIHLPVKQFPK